MVFISEKRFSRFFASVFIFFISSVGVSCGLPETITGTSDNGGEIFYSFPVTGDEGGGDGSSDEDAYDEVSGESYYDDPASDSGYSTETGTAGNSPTSEEPESIPVTIAKCEIEEDEENDDESTQALVKNLQTRSGRSAVSFMAKGQQVKNGPSRFITLKSSPGTYNQFWLDEEFTVIAVNLHTGAMATTSLKKDGSFGDLPIEVSNRSNSIWISATDGELHLNPVVITVDGSFADEESFERCAIPDDSVSIQLSEIIFLK